MNNNLIVIGKTGNPRKTKISDIKIESDGKAMQEEVRRVLLSRNGGVIK